MECLWDHGELALLREGVQIGAEGIPGTGKKERNLCWDASRKLDKNCVLQSRQVSWHCKPEVCVGLTDIKAQEQFDGAFVTVNVPV